MRWRCHRVPVTPLPVTRLQMTLAIVNCCALGLFAILNRGSLRIHVFPPMATEWVNPELLQVSMENQP